MSLIDHLRDPESSVRIYLEGISPGLRPSAEDSGPLTSSDQLRLWETARSPVLHQRPTGIDGALVGTAFDYRARMELGGLDVLTSTAAIGAKRITRDQSILDNGRHKARVVRSAFEVAYELSRSQNQLDWDRASVLLAYCEQIYRAGVHALKGSLGSRLDAAVGGRDLAADVDLEVLRDIGQLISANRGQLVAWKDDVASGMKLDSNPKFSGAYLVDGADGDWIVGDTLVDCKVYSEITSAKLRAYLLQLLGYVMLDLDDRYAIRNVAVWLPRHRVFAEWPLTLLLGGDVGELLPHLRDGFLTAASGRQIAQHEPVSEQRRHEMLAENRHTPFDMLQALGESESVSIRRRVGRNVVTPPDSIRLLSRDRSWSVREAVALNPSSPPDVLMILSADRSTAVRRAVASNPAAPSPILNALAHDTRRDVSLRARASSAHGSGEGVIEASGTSVQRGRDPAAWNSRTVQNLIGSILDERPLGGTKLPVPEASHRWASIEGRDIRVPTWLRRTPPRPVVEDMLRADRPHWIRWRASWELPIEEAQVRARLLVDDNPEIRWVSLNRTTQMVAGDLSDFLGELAVSRSARLSFRRSGAKQADLTPIVSDHDVLIAVASHASTPVSVLSGLARNAPVDLRLALLRNPAFPAQGREALIEGILRIVSAAPRAALATIRSLETRYVERLARDRSADVRCAVAARADLSSEVVTELAGDSDWGVRLTLLENDATVVHLQAELALGVLRDSPEVELAEVIDLVETCPRDDSLDTAIVATLERMSKSRLRAPDLRWNAARHPRTPVGALRNLASSSDQSIRGAVAANSGTPHATLAALARDEEADVRRVVAENDLTPAQVFEDLASDHDPRVRMAVARRADLADALLRRLLNDPDLSVQRAAGRHPRAATFTQASAQRLTSESLDVAAGGPGEIDRGSFEAMAADSRAERRTMPAYDPKTPSDILELLGGDRRSKLVRRAVAANPYAPARLLRALAEDDDEQVRLAVAFNQATPSDVLLDLSGRGVDLALFVALNPDAPDAVLQQLAADPEAFVAYVAMGALEDLNSARDVKRD